VDHSEDQDTESIEFQATVSKVTTLADSGIRISLDLPEDAIYSAAWLMEVRRASGVVSVTVSRDASDIEDQDEDE
jgi:hypothetical protein